MLPCTWCTIFLLPCSPDHSMPDIILDLNLLVFAARAMEPAQEKPHVTPFTLDKRDTKDLATLVLNKSQNKRRRLDKNPKHKLRSLPPAAPLSLSCRLARAALCPCFLSPARPRSRPCSLASTLRARRSTSSRTNASAWTRTSCKNPRALPLSRAASGSLSLSCAASLVLPLARAPSLLSQAGTDGRWARRSRAGGGALLVLCRLTGLGAREVTLLPARTAIEMATTARAAAPILTAPAPSIAQQSVACPPSPSPSLSLSCAPRVPLVCPSLSLSCAPRHGMAGHGEWRRAEEMETSWKSVNGQGMDRRQPRGADD